jgi:hypothetical protein
MEAFNDAFVQARAKIIPPGIEFTLKKQKFSTWTRLHSTNKKQWKAYIMTKLEEDSPEEKDENYQKNMIRCVGAYTITEDEIHLLVSVVADAYEDFNKGEPSRLEQHTFLTTSLNKIVHMFRIHPSAMEKLRELTSQLSETRKPATGVVAKHLWDMFHPTCPEDANPKVFKWLITDRLCDPKTGTFIGDFRHRENMMYLPLEYDLTLHKSYSSSRVIPFITRNAKDLRGDGIAGIIRSVGAYLSLVRASCAAVYSMSTILRESTIITWAELFLFLSLDSGSGESAKDVADLIYENLTVEIPDFAEGVHLVKQSKWKELNLPTEKLHPTKFHVDVVSGLPCVTGLSSEKKYAQLIHIGLDGARYDIARTTRPLSDFLGGKTVEVWYAERYTFEQWRKILAGVAETNPLEFLLGCEAYAQFHASDIGILEEAFSTGVVLSEFKETPESKQWLKEACDTHPGDKEELNGAYARIFYSSTISFSDYLIQSIPSSAESMPTMQGISNLLVRFAGEFKSMEDFFGGLDTFKATLTEQIISRSGDLDISVKSGFRIDTVAEFEAFLLKFIAKLPIRDWSTVYDRIVGRLFDVTPLEAIIGARYHIGFLLTNLPETPTIYSERIKPFLTLFLVRNMDAARSMRGVLWSPYDKRKSIVDAFRAARPNIPDDLLERRNILVRRYVELYSMTEFRKLIRHSAAADTESFFFMTEKEMDRAIRTCMREINDSLKYEYATGMFVFPPEVLAASVQ